MSKDKVKINESLYSVIDGVDEGIIVNKPKDGVVVIEFRAEAGYTWGSYHFDLKKLLEFLDPKSKEDREVKK